MKGNFKKHINKKLVKVGTTIILIVTVFSGVYIYKISQNKKEAIELVKMQTSDITDGVTFDQAYRKYVQHLNYTFYKDHEGNEFVQVNGKINLKDKDRIADLCLTYIVDRENSNLKFYSMTLDKMSCTEIDALILRIKCFSSFDGNNV